MTHLIPSRLIAPKTVNHAVKAARMLFKAARRDGVIGENPFEYIPNVRAHVRSQEIRSTFSLEQLRAVLAVADPEWKSLVLFGFYTGQRLGDLARLRWNSVDLVNGRLTLVTAKTGKRLLIPLAAPLKQHIESLPREALSPNAPLHAKACAIVEREGRSGTLSRQFGELLALAGLRPRDTPARCEPR
jgi:integrase